MQPNEQIIARVAQEVLETMAFALVLPGEPETASDGPVVRSTVGFEGPFCGSVSLAVPEAVLPELAATMLGAEESGGPTPEQQSDALGELANVMCGNLVQALAGPEPVFRLDAPRVATEPETAPDPGVRTVAARVALENGWAELSLAWKEKQT